MKVQNRLFLVFCLILFLTTFFSSVSGKELVNMEFKEAPLADVLQILGQIGGYNVLVDQSVTGQVSFILRDLSVTEALDLVTKASGYRYKLLGNTLVVGSAERLEREFETEDIEFITIKHVDVLEAEKFVKMVVPRVKTSYCTERQLLILFGFTTDLRRAKEAVAKFDQPKVGQIVKAEPQTEPETLESDRIFIVYSDGEEILQTVRSLWPHREFKFDENSRSLTGFAANEEWAEIKSFVEELDLPKFVLKGFLKSQDTTIVLIDYEGSTALLVEGDVLQGWQLSSITERTVLFTRDKRSFTVRMGR